MSVGNYTGCGGHNESINPYRDGKSQFSNQNSSNYNYVTKNKRTQKKIQRKVKELKDHKCQLQSVQTK